MKDSLYIKNRTQKRGDKGKHNQAAEVVLDGRNEGQHCPLAVEKVTADEKNTWRKAGAILAVCVQCGTPSVWKPMITIDSGSLGFVIKITFHLGIIAYSL